MEKTKQKDEKKKLTPFTSIGIDKNMMCGPDGCSLADHFDWAKDKQDKKNK